MSTDPRWDRESRRRRGQSRQAGLGGAIQGLGQNLLQYWMQGQLQDRAQKAQDANVPTLQDLLGPAGPAAGLGGGQIGPTPSGAPMGAPSGAPMGAVGQSPLHAAIEASGLPLDMGMRGPLGQLAASVLGDEYGHALKNRVIGTVDEYNFTDPKTYNQALIEQQRRGAPVDVRPGTIGASRIATVEKAEDKAALDQQKEARAAADAAERQALAEKREERLIEEKVMDNVRGIATSSGAFPWAGWRAEPPFLGAAVDSVSAGLTEPEAVAAVRSGFLRDIVNKKGLVFTLPSGEKIKSDDITEHVTPGRGRDGRDSFDLRWSRTWGRSRMLDADEIQALFEAWSKTQKDKAKAQKDKAKAGAGDNLPWWGLQQ